MDHTAVHRQGSAESNDEGHPRPTSPQDDDDIEGEEDEDEEEEVAIEPPPDLTQEAIVRQGYLKKRALHNFQHHWNKRWFVLRKTRLSIYKDENEYKLLHVIKLRECTFKNKSKNSAKFTLATPSRSYHIKASSKETRDEWVEAIRELQLESLNKHVINQLSLGTAAAAAAAGASPSPVSTPSPSTAAAPPAAAHSPETTDVSDGDELQDSDEEEFVAATEAREEEQIIKQGFLHKLGRRRKIWHKRWFVLRDSGRLQMYENDKEYVLHKILKLKLCSECTIPTNPKRPFSFQLMSPKRKFVFAAGSEEERTAWVTALNALLLKLHTSMSPLVTPIPEEPAEEVPSLSV